jgi:pimeloyl-ACP methyl ester carboxylesterase
MEDVRIPARDGLELVGYLTRATTEGPSPLILLVHGGPWARDYWGFDARCQWFANRGYSTLKVRRFYQLKNDLIVISNFDFRSIFVDLLDMAKRSSTKATGSGV